ncbi:MAG TPA: hypothetical protein VFP68_24955 [Burkholderiaceae bacterium]|nr:hypothetical protein [Burkholderiaceae bacterium]
MNLKIVTLVAALPVALFAGSAAHAQASAASAAAPSSPAKKELVQRVVRLQQPGIDGLARQLVEQPAAQMAQQAQMALQQRIAPDKREAVGRELQADIKKYVDETTPVVRERVSKVVPPVLTTMFEEKFNEDELKTLAAWLESPVSHKFQQALSDVQRAVLEKVGPEVNPLIEPKARALQQSMISRLGLQQPGQAGSAAAGASTPKKK